MTRPSTIYLETMGCQMNALDSELVMDQLLSRGYRPTEDLFQADVVVINTCSVRQHAEDKVHSRIGELSGSRAKNPDQIVAIIGCMAERDGDALLGRKGAVDVLCGPGDLQKLPLLLDEARQTRRPAIALSGKLQGRSTFLPLSDDSDLETLDRGRSFGLTDHVATPKIFGRHQAYVRITRGCNKYCSFCVVPMTRGPEVHRPPGSILDEVRRLTAAGVVEVTLLGQTVNHYHYDDDGEETSFADLLKLVHDRVPDLPRLRFVTSFPRDFTDETLEVMAASPRICRYLHIPAQSGSNSVLKRMNRGYTIEQYLGLLDRARAIMPDISLSGDMIVGFPGESEEDFRLSTDLLRRAQYKNCYIFKYSPRPGTVAYDRLTDEVPEDVKRRRNNDLLAIQSQISLTRNRSMIDEDVEVLVEGPSKRTLKLQESEQD
ncbi:MAG TPA: tRNA (N6-isopentenyl adenosine(37)-C2)-methylthiotransferase MiaB, partial [Phycisphaerae bacterium]|nr:tRNA (N6-isopentenyl adenosine(37)-C2)-methylthiotransferase MiaB [Phycisphaerae bacterium]